MIKGILPLLIIVLAGCAAAPVHKYVAPSVAPVRNAVSSAVASVVKVSGYVGKAQSEVRTIESDHRFLNVSPAIKDVETDLKSAQDQIASTTSDLKEANSTIDQLQNQIVILTANANKEAANVQYWHAKQEKALKQLWVYRSIAIGLGIIMAGILIWKFKSALSFLPFI